MMRRTAACLFLALLLSVVCERAEAVEKSYSLQVSTGLGYDSNAFLAPGKSYFDPIAGEIVVPEKKSGFFVPLSVEGRYAHGGEGLRFLSSLDFEGRFYPRRELNNADAYRTELGGGLDFPLGGKERRRNSLYLGPSVAYIRELYFDRDTGLERVTARSRQDLGDRFTYLRYGLEARLRIKTLPVEFDLKGEISKYDHEEVPVLDSLDYVLYLLKVDAEIDIVKNVWLRAGADYFIRAFEDRRSRDLGGDLVDGTDRKYSYYGAGALLGSRLTGSWTASVSYDYLRRVDDFAGYNDYGMNRFRLQARYRDRQERRLSVALSYWDRDYPRAFAFDDPDFPRKNYIAWEGRVRGEVPLKKAWKIWTDYEYIDQNSSDPRYDYKRHQISAGVGKEL